MIIAPEPFFRKKKIEVNDNIESERKIKNNNSTISENFKKKTEKQIQNDIKKIGEILNKKQEKMNLNLNSKINPNIKSKENNKDNTKTTSKVNSKIDSKETPNPLPNQIKIKSQEFPLPNLPSKILSLATLPEININNNHKIEDFYPYFMKTNLLDLYQYNDIKSNFRTQDSICLDPICEICDMTNKLNCLQCLPGNFLLNEKCYSACPINFIADVYQRKCIPITLRTRNTFSRVTYLKAFSTGSCKNLCGRDSLDCSCHPECKRSGNCCSDYRDCEVLNRSQITQCSKNCELCSDTNKCGQCKPGYFLRSQECVESCDSSDKISKHNMICSKTNRCLVDNCLECEDNNPSVCRQCFNGNYLHNNMCHISCPGTLRADRMNWICLESNMFSWYWVFPSKSSCRNKCDMIAGDCSCRQDCINYGNCCQDVEDYCYKFIIS